MKIEASTNEGQMDNVEVTMTVTMKLKEWEIVKNYVRAGERSSGYHHTAVAFWNLLNDTIKNFREKLTTTYTNVEG